MYIILNFDNPKIRIANFDSPSQWRQYQQIYSQDTKQKLSKLLSKKGVTSCTAKRLELEKCEYQEIEILVNRNVLFIR